MSGLSRLSICSSDHDCFDGAAMRAGKAPPPAIDLADSRCGASKSKSSAERDASNLLLLLGIARSSPFRREHHVSQPPTPAGMKPLCR